MPEQAIDKAALTTPLVSQNVPQAWSTSLKNRPTFTEEVMLETQRFIENNRSKLKVNYEKDGTILIKSDADTLGGLKKALHCRLVIQTKKTMPETFIIAPKFQQFPMFKTNLIKLNKILKGEPLA